MYLFVAHQPGGDINCFILKTQWLWIIFPYLNLHHQCLFIDFVLLRRIPLSLDTENEEKTEKDLSERTDYTQYQRQDME